MMEKIMDSEVNKAAEQMAGHLDNSGETECEVSVKIKDTKYICSCKKDEPTNLTEVCRSDGKTLLHG